MEKYMNVQEAYGREGDDLFKNLYVYQRGAFVQWAKKTFTCDEQTSLEVFQEAMVVLYYKVSKKELVEIRSTLKTYLFAIGRNLLLRRFEHDSRISFGDETLPEVEVNDLHFNTELTYEQIRLKRAFHSLNSGCQKLLRLFYYKNYAIDAIKNTLKYSSEEVVRTKKYKCLKQLKKLMLNSKPTAK